MILPRRQFLFGLVGALAAPAVIRTPGLLMPVCSRDLRPSAPVTMLRLRAGEMFIDQDQQISFFYNGQVWQPVYRVPA